MEERIAIVGLGYVGLPLAVEFAKSERLPAVIGYDISAERVRQLASGNDATREVDGMLLAHLLQRERIRFTTDAQALADATCVIVTVPTPVDDANVPDLSLVCDAASTIGVHLTKGTVVVLESTVYSGVTEGAFGNAIDRCTQLVRGRDWFLGYSPERINPGDRAHTIAHVVKIISGMDAATTERLAGIYGTICHGGIFRAPSISAAEVAKAAENGERDLLIAYRNEIAILCHAEGIPSDGVFAAMETKWNAIRGIRPGMPGGHCIPVDPFYVAHRMHRLGLHPDVILAGRRVNDGMASHIADRLLKLLAQTGKPLRGARVLVLGLAFKPNVPDTRNSKVRDAIARMREFGCEVVAHDPLVPAQVVNDGFRVANVPALENAEPADAILVATTHDAFRSLDAAQFARILRTPAVVFDVGGMFREVLSGQDGIAYGSL